MTTTSTACLRALALYRRCFAATSDFSVEVEGFSGACAGDPGLLRWRVGHRADSSVRARGVTRTASWRALVGELRDARDFLRRTQSRTT